jgi:hypothetical protein
MATRKPLVAIAGVLQELPTGDVVVDTTTMGTLINGATAKTPPVDADYVGLMDSAASNVLKKLSWANIKATVLAYALTVANTWTKAQIGSPVALAVASNLIAVDLSLANNFTLPLQATTGQTLSNPTNVVAGQSGNIAITQNATPSTLAFGAYWQEVTGAIPTVSTTASSVNVLSYYVVSSTKVWYQLNKGGVA